MRYEIDIIAYTEPEPGKKMGRPVRFDDVTAEYVFLMLWDVEREKAKKELLAVDVTKLYEVDEGVTLKAICTVLQGQMNHAVHNAYNKGCSDGRKECDPQAQELRRVLQEFLKG